MQNKEVRRPSGKSKMTKMIIIFPIFGHQKVMIFPTLSTFGWLDLANLCGSLARFGSTQHEKKWKIQHSNVSCTSPAAHFLEKSWFQANFPNSFLRRLRETKSKCSFQGDRLPSFLRNRVRFYFLGACQRWQFIFSNPDALVSVGEEIGEIQCFGDILKKFGDCVVLAKIFVFFF